MNRIHDIYIFFFNQSPGIHTYNRFSSGIKDSAPSVDYAIDNHSRNLLSHRIE